MINILEAYILVQSKIKTLIVVLIGSFMTTLDINIVNVALPKMSSSLSVDMGTIQWVVTSYLIVISTLVLMFGRLADIKGKKSIYQKGFLVFSAGSLFCSLSGNMPFLICARVVQGIGAAMMMSCNFGIITMTFPFEERGRAVGMLGTVVAVGTMTGPPLGGFLVGTFSWQSIFIINIPIGIAAYFAGVKYLPSDTNLDVKKSFDIKGSLLYATFVVPFFLALLNGESLGYNSPIIMLLFAVSIASFIMFCLVELKVSAPMLDFSLFKNSMFSVGIFCAFISYLVIYFTNIIQPFYLQHILEMSPQEAGFIMMVYPVTAAIMAPLGGVLCDKIGYKPLTLIGLTATCLGIFSMSFLNVNSSRMSIMAAMAILGSGYGLFQSPNNAGVMSAVPKNKLGISGSVNSLIRNLGMTSGISLSIAIFYNRMGSKLGHHVSALSAGRPDVFISSMRFVYCVGAGIAIAGIAAALLRLGHKERKVHG